MTFKVRKVGVLLALGLVLLLSACSKERFKMFDDLDCITTTEVVKMTVPLTEIPGNGGFVKITPHIYNDITYYQKGVIIDSKQDPIADYTVALVEAPTGTSIQRVEEGFVLQVAENLHFDQLPIVVAITAKGVTRNFTFIQERAKVKVDVELL